ncbi:cobalt transporter CbiM [Arthrospira platensis]|jgi:cobalt/nickel transport system permease protein|uniref:Cobalamin biosynthesis protein M n=1 Tax=Limnospira platensis NIES-46 TaxID=1236695 RepID=A0A5M3T6Z8_LIMPL|nr:cobalt transporter CbiM [Arthrospira platensis]AMW28111.1 cobalamin biosynthesis protein CbiM [Arthrospira platensis YZ]KDR57245.1 cobalamin biosynthesis protein CbiM [Arthrospira platensis str. Paraca]MBD2670896.1 cobalt transporter CbiM [Arthrospira platensis FACHB-439]MBD2711731.1 cobalt transporter CbiM [Arthrospira platensis FACHB-835]MDF2209230.1 cobalt transporter CbiM [Arthrospira platensis NCB002]MDT9184367.1 cobalt transporter CbiM [Limnospira sp. PMC 289.06]MDT9296525.1 cobalt 
MHISEGIIPAQICLAGYGITGLVTWYSLRQINRQANPTANIPKASLLTAAFFVASSIHIPIPPASVHLVLNGLLGAILGYYAFPAILIGLIFQAIIFGHGGLTTLGINGIIMGIPAIIAAVIFQSRHRFSHHLKPTISLNLFGFLAGASSVGFSTILFLVILITNLPSTLESPAEKAAIIALIIAHIPLMFIEGVFTAMVVNFLSRVKPELLTQ